MDSESFENKKAQFDELMQRRFFYTNAYEIYGGVKGLYDYGPPGSAILANLLHYWRQFFVIEENMLEISTASLTPEVVFKTSGHVDKFEDKMVRDLETLTCYRADHLLEDKLELLMAEPGIDDGRKQQLQFDFARADDFSCEELGEKLKLYNIKSPETGNDLSDPFPFNLMFKTFIGPTGDRVGYLRPETAQGMFVNFPRLLECNGGKLPFAAAQIGPAFRNEIAPRNGLLRVREFTLAEIEHFVDPRDKSHPKFGMISDYVLPLYARGNQLGDGQIVPMQIGDAVAQGVVNNETLGYFLVRVHQFLVSIGVRPENIRFRQHLENEMAHYASDCWDGEIKTSFGWVECIGNADRACYDLSVHAKASGKRMKAYVQYDTPREVSVIVAEVNKQLIGKTLRGAAKPLMAYFDHIIEEDEQDALREIFENFQSSDTQIIEGIEVTKEMIKLVEITKTVQGEHICPSVIEPSFGIGRILYSLLEQSFWCREGTDGTRLVLSLKPHVAPLQCAIFPLLQQDEFLKSVNVVADQLRKSRISHRVDVTGGAKIGKRYTRFDELGVPFGVTVDHKTLEEGTITIRERDSTEQVRVPLTSLSGILNSLIFEEQTWQQLASTYGLIGSSSE
jgi:glycyl-tRNA synthetase